jgi:hypothetical protein
MIERERITERSKLIKNAREHLSLNHCALDLETAYLIDDLLFALQHDLLSALTHEEETQK